LKAEEMYVGARVVIPNTDRYRENRGTLIEVSTTEGGTKSDRFTGGIVAMDDGTKAHRWSWELLLQTSQLSPRQRLVWNAMQLGARRVPGSPDHARRYVGGGVDLTVSEWVDEDEDSLGPLWREFAGEAWS